MDVRKFLDIMTLAERLKDVTRHCYTSKGRRESVAEHCWRATLMAFFMRDEFPKADMDKVIKMCIIHDIGEAFTGDIPVFNKTAADEEKEERVLESWVKTLPEPYSKEMLSLYDEMEMLESLEAKIYKAIDGLEAVIQHNESDINTWLPNEYELNLVYAEERVQFSDWLKKLRAEMKADTLKKIEAGNQ